jgi:geranylgeranyl diphosphate synthase type I
MNKTSDFSTFAALVRPSLREELQKTVRLAGLNGTPELQTMIGYQLGWNGENAGLQAEGKQIRPLLCLLSTEAGGGSWKTALPAAAAVELIHNFSLIHDDIEDRGELRRGRPTIWKIWGEAQAINTGDAMFALASLALTRLGETLSAEIAHQAGILFQTTALRLTQGQHLDIAFENMENITLEEYWQMVEGKTAALLGFSLEVGALCAGVSSERQGNLRDFGLYLGLAFQAQDDILGIWGDEKKIGKSNTGDLVVRKKTLPVLFGLDQKKDFYEAWQEDPITPDLALEMAQMLEAEGGYAYAQKTANKMTDQALTSLKKALPENNAGQILVEIAQKLLKRNQ